MPGVVPPNPKLYHIVHMDRLPSIVSNGFLWCDAEVQRRELSGTTIGMAKIKQRRLTELKLTSYPDLFVGNCVPFYFCPRSIMLYLIHQRNSDLAHKDGQGQIVHLQADLHAVTAWADDEKCHWAFTLSNAGAYIFEDRCDLSCLGEIDWDAVAARNWSGCKEGKQAEFLVEHRFPWSLVERIGVHSPAVAREVAQALTVSDHRPVVEVVQDWYY